MENNKINERLASAETRLDQHDQRLNRHSDRIDTLQAENIKQNAVLEKLCNNLDKNSELTKKNQEMIAEIHTQGKTTINLVKAIVYGVPALFALYTAVKQFGLF